MTTQTFDDLIGLLRVFGYAPRIEVPVDVCGAMRRHRVTIKTLATRMQISQKRVRQVRALDRLAFINALDFMEAIERPDRLPWHRTQSERTGDGRSWPTTVG